MAGTLTVDETTPYSKKLTYTGVPASQATDNIVCDGYEWAWYATDQTGNIMQHVQANGDTENMPDETGIHSQPTATVPGYAIILPHTIRVLNGGPGAAEIVVELRRGR